MKKLVIFSLLMMSTSSAWAALSIQNCEFKTSAKDEWTRPRYGRGKLRFYQIVRENTLSNECPDKIILKPGVATLDVLHFVSDADNVCAYRSLGHDLNVSDESQGIDVYALRCKRHY